MKKYFLIVALLFVGLVFDVYAEFPETSNGGTVNVEYGGLNISTSSFEVDGDTIAGRVSINSVYFSSGTTADFIDIFVTTNTQGAGSQLPILRIFNYSTAIATGVINNAGVFSGGLVPVGNMRFTNVVWRAGQTTVPRIAVLYYREGDR